MPIGIHGSLTHNKVLPMPLGVAARTPTPGPNDISRPKTAKRVLGGPINTRFPSWDGCRGCTQPLAPIINVC